MVHKLVNRASTPSPAAAAPVHNVTPIRLQPSAMRVSSPGAPTEKKAEATEKKILRMPAPAVRTWDSPYVARHANAIARAREHAAPRLLTRHDKAVTDAGKHLIANEPTHTIQQGAATSAPTVQRSEDVRVGQPASSHVQGLALAYFANAANAIPGFRMFTILLGVNPIDMSRVDRNAAHLLRAVVEFLPGGILITQALDTHGLFDRAGAVVEQQLAGLGLTAKVIGEAIRRFVESLSWTDTLNLGGVWRRAMRILSEPVDRVLQSARGLYPTILRLIKDAILVPLARIASGQPGWDLLCAVIGTNPITSQVVPRTAETLIGGFMKLIGQGEIWENIKRANAIGRAWAWFQGALSGLMGFVRQIPQLFVQALTALGIGDLIDLPAAFARVAGVFGTFLPRFFSWAGNTIWDLLEIIFMVVAPGVMVYLRRAGGAFRTILRDPIGFVGKLVRAGVQGFQQFAANFHSHLRASLIGWLTGALGGLNIHVPQSLAPRELIQFVLSVLGVTWQSVRQKLVRVIGETAVRVLETGFDIVVALVTQGPAAAWEKIQETLGNLRDMVLDQLMSFVHSRIVAAAVTRLGSMLNPASAFIQAIIAIYDTVMFFVERLRQIAQVAASFIDAIATIAAGNIAPAAARVEQTMAGMMTLVVSFLARIAGLGKVSDAVTNIINRVRASVDRAIDRVIEWIVARARRLGQLASSAAGAVVDWWRSRRPFRYGTESHTLFFDGEGAAAQLSVRSTKRTIRDYLNNVVKPNIRPTNPKAGTIPLIEAEIDKIEAIKAATRGGFGQEKGQLISDALNRIAILLSELGNDVPETKIKTQTPRTLADGSEVGEEMVAEPLTRRPGSHHGSAPFEKTATWRAVNRRRRAYVRGHLLNHHLYGAGNNKNLVPITRSLNTTMSSNVEEKVKAAVLAQGLIVRYSVKFNFEGHSGTRKIPQESHLPTSVDCTAEEIELKSGAWVHKKSIIPKTRLEHTLPPDTDHIDEVS